MDQLAVHNNKTTINQNNHVLTVGPCCETHGDVKWHTAITLWSF